MKNITNKSNTDTSSNEYPYGSIRDKTALQAGTPVNTDVYSDMHQFFEVMFSASRSEPNGLLENSNNGFQTIKSLGQFISRVSNPFFNFSINAASPAGFPTTWTCNAYGGGVYARVSGTDIYTWGILVGGAESRKYNGVDDINCIAYAPNGRFMAIAYDGVSSYAIYSDDYGANWVVMSGLFVGEILTMYYNTSLDKWVFFSVNGTVTTVSSSSDNGDTFTTETTISNFQAKDVAYSERKSGTTIVVGESSVTTAKVYSSTLNDLTSWASITHTATNNPFIAVTTSNLSSDKQSGSFNLSPLIFAAITDNSVDSGTLVVYNDPENSLTTTYLDKALSNKEYKSICFGNGKFILLSNGAASDANLEQTFDFFRNINEVSNILSTDISDCVYADGFFISCGSTIYNLISH